MSEADYGRVNRGALDATSNIIRVDRCCSNLTLSQPFVRFFWMPHSTVLCQEIAQVLVCETRAAYQARFSGWHTGARPWRVPRRSHRLGILYPTRRLSRALLGYTSDVFSVG